MGGDHLPAAHPPPGPGAVMRPGTGWRWPVSVAPMMDRTDRHFRAFMRRITRETLLYTEMITTGAILHGDRDHLLGFSPEERPLTLQLGGDDPTALAACASLAERLGYDEVNLNVGCPSDRVQRGRFGVCLMKEPSRVAAGIAAMRASTAIPVTVKHRIGVDSLDRYEDLARFVATVAEAGPERFIVHARKAWLQGLSPKENRTVPPLRYQDVYRLKREFPHLRIEINGGVRAVDSVRSHLARVDGVMIGRAAYEDPYLFATFDRDFYGSPEPPPTRREVVAGMLIYAESWLERGLNLQRITRHLLPLMNGLPGARSWRRLLSERSHLPGAGPELLEVAMKSIPSTLLEESPSASPPVVAG